MDLTRLKAIKDQQAQQLADRKRDSENKISNLDMQETVVKSFARLVEYLDGKTSRTLVVNQIKDFATSQDAQEFVSAIDSLHATLKTHENTDLSEITEVMKAVLEEAKKIPKEHPEEKEEQFVDYTKQVESLISAVKTVEEAVKAQELKVEAPQVNVEAPVVNVEAPDLKPLSKELSDKFTKAIKGIVFPEYKTDNTEVEKLLKKANKYLANILDKPSSFSGGGSTWIAVNASGTPVPLELTPDGKLPVEAGATSTYQSFNDTTTDTNLVYLGKALPGSDATDAAWQIKRYNKSAGTMTFADDVTTFTKQWSERTTYGY